MMMRRCLLCATTLHRANSSLHNYNRQLWTTPSSVMISKIFYSKSPLENRTGIQKNTESRMNSPHRWLSQGTQGSKNGESQIKSILQKSFPSALNILVEDISGGCGSMYKVYVEAKEFEGLSIVKQHQLVNKALKEEIKDMHGIRIQTEIPRK